MPDAQGPTIPFMKEVARRLSELSGSEKELCSADEKDIQKVETALYLFKDQLKKYKASEDKQSNIDPYGAKEDIKAIEEWLKNVPKFCELKEDKDISKVQKALLNLSEGVEDHIKDLEEKKSSLKKIANLTMQDVQKASPREKALLWDKALESAKDNRDAQNLRKEVAELINLFEKDPKLTFTQGMNKIFGDSMWPDWISDISESLGSTASVIVAQRFIEKQSTIFEGNQTLDPKKVVDRFLEKKATESSEELNLLISKYAKKEDSEAVKQCVSKKIPILMNEGYEQKQAIAIAFNMCRKDSEAYKKSNQENCNC